MTRVWLVDDELPYGKLIPVADKVEGPGLEYLVRTEAKWSDDPAVRALCERLTQDTAVEVTALSAQAVLTKYLDSGMSPPHVVIFDWEGLGFWQLVAHPVLLLAMPERRGAEVIDMGIWHPQQYEPITETT